MTKYMSPLKFQEITEKKSLLLYPVHCIPKNCQLFCE